MLQRYFTFALERNIFMWFENVVCSFARTYLPSDAASIKQLLTPDFKGAIFQTVNNTSFFRKGNCALYPQSTERFQDYLANDAPHRPNC